VERRRQLDLKLNQNKGKETLASLPRLSQVINYLRDTEHECYLRITLRVTRRKRPTRHNGPVRVLTCGATNGIFFFAAVVSSSGRALTQPEHRISMVGGVIITSLHQMVAETARNSPDLLDGTTLPIVLDIASRNAWELPRRRRKIYSSL